MGHGRDEGRDHGDVDAGEQQREVRRLQAAGAGMGAAAVRPGDRGKAGGVSTPSAIDRVKQTIIARIEACLERREQAVRAALKSDETWYAFRQMYPPPEDLEGR